MTTSQLDIRVRLSFVGNWLTDIEISVAGLKSSYWKVSVQDYVSHFVQQLSQSTNLKPLSNLLVSPSESKKETLPKEEDKIVQLVYNHDTSAFGELLNDTEEGLKTHSPELCDEGVNGTYFLKNKAGKSIAVFKPNDEEGDSANNPKTKTGGSTGNQMTGIKPGEASLREVAAYLLDKQQIFGVPKTALAKINHSSFGSVKFGSLQEFVENDGASWDVGSSMFPVNEVQKIGILDVYMLNMDRHGGNILFREGDNGIELIPIDNGFSLPDTVAIPNLWFEWMTWSQSKKPFSQDLVKFIQQIDVDSDVKMLKDFEIRNECLRIMKVMGTLLKKAVAYGLSLYDIGSILCPPKPDEISELNKLWDAAVAETKWDANLEEDDSLFLNTLFQKLDKVLVCKARK